MYVQYNTWIACQAYINRIEAVTLDFCREYFPERIGVTSEGKEVLLPIKNETWEVDPDATPTEQWDFPRPTADGKFCALKPTQREVGQIPIALYDALIEDGVEVESYIPLPKA